MNLARGRPRRPILRREFDSPEMRAGRGELDAHARAFIRGVAEIDDPAFLLLLGDGIDENQIPSDDERFVQVEEPAMRIDHDRLAVFFEFTALDVFSRGLYGDAGEDS